MTNRDVLDKIFPDIPEYSGIDTWGDFWDEEYIPQNKEQLEDETLMT